MLKYGHYVELSNGYEPDTTDVKIVKCDGFKTTVLSGTITKSFESFRRLQKDHDESLRRV